VKIGIIRRGFSSTGGAEAYLLRLAGGLATLGHEPVLVTSAEWPSRAWKFGDIVRLPGSTPSSFAAAFRTVKDRFDVTLALERTPGCDIFRAGDGVHAAWLRRRAQFEPTWKSFLQRWKPKNATLMALEREVFKQTRHIVANSQMVADEIAEHYNFPPERLHVIPNGIASGIPLRPRDEARAALKIAPGTFCTLFVGTGWERKGLRTAIAAAEAADALLLVAGRGKASQYAGKNVRFLGPVSDLPAIFSAADAFVLPTIYDPFSNACLEALAAGLPVVTTTSNGFSEIIENGVHGHAVPAGDATATAAALAFWRTRDRDETAAACQALAGQYTVTRNVSAIAKIAESIAFSRKI